MRKQIDPRSFGITISTSVFLSKINDKLVAFMISFSHKFNKIQFTYQHCN